MAEAAALTVDCVNSVFQAQIECFRHGLLFSASPKVSETQTRVLCLLRLPYHQSDSPDENQPRHTIKVR